MKRLNFFPCLALSMLIFNAYALAQPKLILQITIDQFAGNQLDRFEQHIKEGGFRMLLRHGLWYDHAFHPHATTQTAAGHTTLATGTPPAIHGIIANNWWDRGLNKEIYAMYDPAAPLLNGGSTQGAEDGRSPKQIQATSFADSLALASSASHRFAISTKDRGAIPLAGKMGKAFWLNSSTGEYTSSQYYYPVLPQWVKAWNKKQLIKNHLGKSWQLELDCKNYIYCDDGFNHIQSRLTAYGQRFPHPFGKNFNEEYIRRITVSPVGDQLLTDFAKTLINHYHLGHHINTDYLSISFSATDAIGHTFGPNSLESEENFRQLNQTLKSFLQFVDKKVGLANTLIVLSADHGVAPSPTYLRSAHLPTREITSQDIASAPTVKSYLQQHQLDWSQLIINQSPDLYLNEPYLKAKGLTKETVAQSLSFAISQVPGIFSAIPTSQVLNNRLANSPLRAALAAQINPRRSGDIYLIAEPYNFIHNSPDTKGHHGTPWAYDRHVPIIISHPSFKAQRIHHLVSTTALAPTHTNLREPN